MKAAQKYGADYFQKGENAVRKSRSGDLYSYTAFHGEHDVEVEQGDSVIFVDGDSAFWKAGPVKVHSKEFAAVIRGYQCGNKSVTTSENVNLTYVNGCATRQIFAPERVGDPTLQQLTIPPHTSEQVHHIHSTPRIVYVKSGRGFSIVGQSSECEETELLPGMTCVLDPMCPHHFRTEDEYLTVLPIHVYSSTPLENNHPMFLGTKEV